MRRVTSGLGCTLVLALAGCGGTATTPSASATPAAAPPAPATAEIGPPPAGQSEPPVDGPEVAPASAEQQVALQTRDWAGVEQLIASHAGKVVVVDLWSTSCIPCRREFPELVKLHQELGPQVACISVSADYDGLPSKPVETYRERVLEFLTSQHATFDNVLASVPAEDLFNALKIGSIPAVFVYDRTGQRVKVFADPEDGQEFTYANHIRPFVASLLAAP